MKRLIIILIFLFSGIISAQNFSTKDVTNSTDTALDSAGVFSPNEWRLVTNYNSITVTIKSDQSSASSGVKIKFATKKKDGTYVVVDSINATYTAGTIFNNAYPITAPYLKVFYTNTTTAQSYFSMVTMLNVSFGATAISIAGGATAANQTNGTQKTQVVDGSGNVIGSTTNALDINIKSGNITGFATQTTLDSLKKALAPATKFVGLTDTVTTRVDTVAFTGTWAEGEIKADDSCEVAINGSFTTGQTFIITETTAVKIPKWAIATSNKLFIRRYGNIGTVRFYLRLSSY